MDLDMNGRLRCEFYDAAEFASTVQAYALLCMSAIDIPATGEGIRIHTIFFLNGTEFTSRDCIPHRIYPSSKGCTPLKML